MAFDEGLFVKQLKPLGLESQQEIKEYIYNYMRSMYPGWTEERVKYHKYKEKMEC